MRIVAGILLISAIGLFVTPLGVRAQAAPGVNAIERMRTAGVVRIGYRESAVPFSQSTGGAAPIGYSIDLCHAIVEDLAVSTGKALRIEYRPVTPESRLDALTEGRIDFECGSTTMTDDRKRRVAFSPVIFVGGTRLLVRRGTAVHSLRDLSNKTVVGVAGTTNARAMLAQASRVPNVRVRTARGYEEAFTMLDTDNADALAADDVLLAGILEARQWHGRYIMVGDPLTREPYGIAFTRGDPALAAAVEGTFVRLAKSGELRRIYGKWFLEPLPSGATLGLPMGAHLSSVFRDLGLPAE